MLDNYFSGNQGQAKTKLLCEQYSIIYILIPSYYSLPSNAIANSPRIDVYVK